MNSCHFIGRLSQEPEAKKAQSGIVYTKFDIAVQKNKARDADFIHCVAYEPLSGLIVRNSHKGDRVAVSGALTSSKINTKEGIKVEKYVIVVETVEFLGRAAKNEKKEEDTDGDK